MALSRVASDDFRGARGSNTGDDFHELWATRQAIRLLLREGGLTAIALEGLAAADESGEPKGSWDGVDCTLYYGGVDARSDSVTIEQLKYSAANPQTPWTVARLVAGPRRSASVFAKLAKAHAALSKQRSGKSPASIVLVTNQPVDSAVIDAVARAAGSPLQMPRTKPANGAADELKLAYAAGLTAVEFQSFAAALRFEGGAGSRFLLEERVLKAISEWTDLELQQTVATLRQYIRNCMRPEAAGQLITRESVMLRFGASEEHALFPCPSEIFLAPSPVPRKQFTDAAELIRGSGRHVCLHGHGGVGKTTALQEIEATLPPGSVMIKYDCYGGGRYLDAGTFRHRTADAFVQLTNEMASSLRLPLLIGRNPGTDYPRAFSLRLGRAASAIAAANPGALLVVAVDAADNAITAAVTRTPPESSFVQDFVGLTGQEENVRFVVTARTGRLPELRLPSHYKEVEIGPFALEETALNVARVWNAPRAWIEDFHHLSGGNPRVQAYAFQGNADEPSAAIDHLRPNGKSLDEVFRQQFEAAVQKGGVIGEITRLCAGLVILPRPVPLLDLSEVLGISQAKLTDICADLAPGIRLQSNVVSFADEDFEQFVRAEGQHALVDVHRRAADWLLSRMHADAYAALHVASVLIAADRRRELLNLVESEPAPQAVTDPVLRRVAEVQRLRLAIRVCREAVDPGRALRFVLIGAEGIRTDRALRELLLNNPEMAARFAHDPAGRLILSDPRQVANHGRLLFQRLAVDAERDDAIAVREGGRRLQAWLQARKAQQVENATRRDAWTITAGDIAAETEAYLKLDGPKAALRALLRWTPRYVALEVVRVLVPKLIAEGSVARVEQLVGDGLVEQPWALFLICPLALAGQPFDPVLLAKCLAGLVRRKLNVTKFFSGYREARSLHEYVLRSAINACEILTAEGQADGVVDQVLAGFLAEDLRRIDKRDTHEGEKLDILFRAYALQEARAGRTPSVDGLYLPRPEPPPSEQKRPRSDRRYAEEHDRPLLELSRAVFGVYAATAEGLVARSSSADLMTKLRKSVGNLSSEEWRISRYQGARVLRVRAAESMLVLVNKGYDPDELMTLAVSVHGHWRSGYESPDLAFVNTLSLHSALHDRLLQDLIAASTETRTIRAGASEKSERLVTLAKLILPISPDDANSVFNNAIEVAGELDTEIIFQLRFLSRLIGRGMPGFATPKSSAEGLGDIIHDAAIRLAGNEEFPWPDAMSAMAALDTPAALAAAARWDDEDTASLRDTLVPIVKSPLVPSAMTPGEASALDLFLEQDHELARKACEAASELARSRFQRICEETARDSLVRYGHQRNADLATFFRSHEISEGWPARVLQQHDYVDGLVGTGTGSTRVRGASHDRQSESVNRAWDSTTLIDPKALASEVTKRQAEAREQRQYLSVADVLAGARRQVAARNRVNHLRALADLKLGGGTDGGVDAMLEAVDEWWGYPAIRDWCKAHLPDYIVRHLPRLTRYLTYGEDKLEPALSRTGKSDRQLQDLILHGCQIAWNRDPHFAPNLDPFVDRD